MRRAGTTNALSLVKFILLHPCTLFARDGAYYSNVKSNRHVKIVSCDVTYPHCMQCSATTITDTDVFVAILVKFLMRGVYVSATNVIFATDSPKSCSLQCDIIAHHPPSGAVSCVFVCEHRHDLQHTWTHARKVVRMLKMISPPNALINIVVIPMYTYENTQRLVFHIRESRTSRQATAAACRSTSVKPCGRGVTKSRGLSDTEMCCRAPSPCS